MSMLQPKIVNISQTDVTLDGKYLAPGDEWGISNESDSIKKEDVLSALESGIVVYKDYKRVRAEFYVYMVGQGGFENLTEDEKMIAVCNFLVDQDTRLLLLSNDQIIKNGKAFHRFSTMSRRRRMDVALVSLYNRLSPVDTYSILNEPGVAELIDNYVNYGVEGTTEGDGVGLFDFIEARAGTPYEADGIAARSLIPIDGTTMQDLVSDIMTILKDGVYVP